MLETDFNLFFTFWGLNIIRKKSGRNKKECPSKKKKGFCSPPVYFKHVRLSLLKRYYDKTKDTVEKSLADAIMWIGIIIFLFSIVGFGFFAKFFIKDKKVANQKNLDLNFYKTKQRGHTYINPPPYINPYQLNPY